MNVEVVFNKQTTVPYTRMDAVRGFLLAHRLRPCCGLCGCQNVSLVAMRFMLELGQNSSNELIAATFNHLNKREQTLVLELFSEPEYAVLLEKSKKIWSYSVKNLAGEARPESQSQPATSSTGSSSEKKECDASAIKAAAKEQANASLTVGDLLPRIKPDGTVVRNQLLHLRDLFADRLYNSFMERKGECSRESFKQFMCWLTCESKFQTEICKEFARNPEYKELLQFVSESGIFLSPELKAELALLPTANQGQLAPVVNALEQPAAPAMSTSAPAPEKSNTPQEVIYLPSRHPVEDVIQASKHTKPVVTSQEMERGLKLLEEQIKKQFPEAVSRGAQVIASESLVRDGAIEARVEKAAGQTVGRVESAPAKSQEAPVASLPVATVVPTAVQKLKSAQPAHQYNLRPRNSAK